MTHILIFSGISIEEDKNEEGRRRGMRRDNRGNKWEMSLFDTDTFSGGVKQLCSVKRPFVVFALWHLNIWTLKSKGILLCTFEN